MGRPLTAPEGLGLDGEGGRRPQTRRESQPARAGIRSAQGMEAEWPRPLQAGSVHDSPLAKRCAANLCFVLQSSSTYEREISEPRILDEISPFDDLDNTSEFAI